MATIKDVARKTGLSLATISKYLNGGHVLEENRQAIEAAINNLGYSVNRMARGLKTSRSMTVGVLIPDLENAFITSIVSNLENILLQAGYSTLICDYKHNPVIEHEKLAFLAARSIDGLVMMPLNGCPDDLRTLQMRHVPVVLLDRPVRGLTCDAVLVKNRQAAFGAADLLLTAGHRRIGFIGGPTGIYTADERLEGYLAAHQAHDLTADRQLIRQGQYDAESGYQLTVELLSAADPPTALFATNNEMTFGAVLAMHTLGIHIPEDLSVIGFDNQMLATVHQPVLSTVLQPLRQIGETAAELLLRRMRGCLDDYPAVHQLDTIWLPGASVKNLQS
ncbi:MAG: LacI family DNA-binding transcriptional regulator [Clostridiaceae bacterium]|nr:LacI family DNA-binding transcriptional regulator [Clostridiaceae bacterium]